MNSVIEQSQTAKLNPLSVISLVLSLAGFSFMPVLGSVGGIITGYLAKREIASAPALYTHHGLAKAGIILGWLGIVLGLLILLGIVIALVPFTAGLRF